MLAFMQKQIRMIRTLIEISEMYTKTFKISTLWVNRQIGKGVNSSVFHRLITIHVTFIPEVVYITHEKSESRINFKSGESFTSSSITSNWNGKIKSNNSFLYHSTVFNIKTIIKKYSYWKYFQITGCSTSIFLHRKRQWVFWLWRWIR